MRFRHAAAETNGIDEAVYHRHDKDPLVPIIGMGRCDLRVGFFGRDPGRDEVRYGEAFIGAGGQLIRRALHEHLYHEAMPDFDASKDVGKHVFWANTVPYKPVGNKAWSMAVKRRFHPLVRELLLQQWKGTTLVTLGREAFFWFGIDQSKEVRDRLAAFWKRDDRFEAHCEVVLDDAQGNRRSFTLYPLPHPSPLNQVWYRRFPALLKQRLDQVELSLDDMTL
ncbi:uracil-DNA glycosylase family protein [Larsenimonas rhizosphaerae]|uniref:Uracil-DNA glycosylase family protein n=1 Tax=Larsenimonas rhizosphaerae TaxID=2944682 RepID=A0AA42CY03_9GAMM|nr:uracil-DNA glycosylase family protein [Larsenimonas rhizosphaerae]MCM2129850.1 uracil-DNA glycosylase family protein [Larsenimonas rhizosphaerae]MCX2524510.1 uracil-DNA glycosylase family protein [Larsenimonas rhizosphaerae]